MGTSHTNNPNAYYSKLQPCLHIGIIIRGRQLLNSGNIRMNKQKNNKFLNQLNFKHKSKLKLYRFQNSQIMNLKNKIKWFP